MKSHIIHYKFITTFALIIYFFIAGCDKSISSNKTILTYSGFSWDGEILILQIEESYEFENLNYQAFKLICPDNKPVNPNKVINRLSVTEGSDKVTSAILLYFTAPSCNKFDLELPDLGKMNGIEVTKSI